MTQPLKHLGVIGDPIGHSLSPVIHNAMLKELGLPEIYESVHVLPAQLAGWVQAARAGFTGFNATMPHKSPLLPLMDEVSDDAKMYGSVNTVAVRDGKLYGFNTDGEGFILALAEHGVRVTGKKVVMIGAGGAARSVALKTAAAGAEQIIICCRAPQKASQLAVASPRIRIIPLASMEQQLAHCDMLINCTPLGMHGFCNQFTDLSFLNALRADAVVCDLIYRPLETLFLKTAKEHGHTVINGLGMLIYQAILALEQFLGRPLDIRHMRAVVEAALQQVL